MKISSWLIICTFAFALSFSGCSTSQVRKKLPSLAQFEKLKEDEAVQPAQENMNIQQERAGFTTDTVLEPIPTGRRLPTLREQMQKISDNQEKITSRHSELSEDVVMMKQDINQMRESLEDIKNVLEEMRGGKTQVFTKGVESSIQPDIPAARILKSAPASEEILPDNVEDETFEGNVILPDNIQKKTQAIKKKSASKSDFKENQSKTVVLKKNVEPKLKVKEEKSATGISENPVNIQVYNTAMSLFKKRNFAETITLLEGLIRSEKSPGTISNCHYWIGESYFGLGQFSQAIASFKRVIGFKNSEKSDDAQRMIAEAYVKGGNIAEARRAFQRLIDTNPDSELVPLARKKLQQL